MKKTKVGLDLGTNSIGWGILVKEDEKYQFLKKEDENGNLIPTKGVCIFPKGTDASDNSKAAIRRRFRSGRRRIDRIRRRKVATLKVLSDSGLCPPLSVIELRDWRYKKEYPCGNKDFIAWQRTGAKGGNIQSEKNKQPYYLRYLAATRKGLMETQLGRYQLGRAFYHLAQRRGYLSFEEERSEDVIEQFKQAVNRLIEEYSSSAAFLEPFTAVSEAYGADKKVKSLSRKILQKLKNEVSFELITEFILGEFNKKENLGKVTTGINELSQKIEESGHPTLGCYFHWIYGTTKEDGSVERIRGRFIDREKHYLQEFNYICDNQNINPMLKEKLHKAIFYQRPLKSQKGLVAKCPFETKRMRIAVSHPLYEEFRVWESINRIKMKMGNDPRMRALTREEREMIRDEFEQAKDIEFKKIAEKLSQGESYRYVKDKDEGEADIEFNFPVTTTFPGCPTISQLKKVLGKESYEILPLLNTGYKDERGKQQISIEDIWHCLFADSFGNKSKVEARTEFAKKHLKGINAEAFAKIKLKKGYGNLSKAAIKKILPFLKNGYRYSHAVFMANITKVLGHSPSEKEGEKALECINAALKDHEFEKSVNAIVNNYIEKYKNENQSFGIDSNSIWIHQRGIKNEINEWFTEVELTSMELKEREQLEQVCWAKFSDAVKDKHPKNVEFLSSHTIIEFIRTNLSREFSGHSLSLDKLYHPSAMEAYAIAETRLGNPEISSIKNPVFNKAMHQIKRLMNRLIEEGLIDKDTEVNIELAREINSASYRKALSQYQNDQRAIRQWARNKIIECYDESIRSHISPTDDQIVKYILFAEQNGHCLYSGEIITPRKFLTEQLFDIEHTIPQSKLNDNSLKNKTLANADFNRNFKKDELPANLNVSYKGSVIDSNIIIENRDRWLRSYQMSGEEVRFDVNLSSLKAELRKYRNAAKAAANDPNVHDELMMKAHYIRMRLDYLTEKFRTFEMEEIPTRFTNANLVDTRIITKYARAYLKSYFKRVNVINGQITDTLRKIWGLQGQYEEKDRSNHIHHCIDAITVACVEKGTANRMSEAFHKYERDYFDGNHAAKVYLPEPMNDFVGTMKRIQDEVFVYYRQTDRIKPLLDNVKQINPDKLDLRGALNKPNAYGIRKSKSGDFYFVQRKVITKIKDKDIESIADERIKERIRGLCAAKGKKIETIVSENGGYLILPEYEAPDKTGKVIKSRAMVIKKLQLISSKTKLAPYKRIREIDQSKKKYLEFKHDFYFDKESGSNYEANIYGDFLPDGNGKLKREYRLINHFNIVNNAFPKEPSLPLLFKIHSDDLFLVFDKHFDEINWDEKKDLERRLFRNVKFDENSILVFARHSYAGGDVDRALGVTEEELKNKSGVILRRRASTLKAIPTRVDELGRLDIEYSKAFVEKLLKESSFI